jgi:hypothetical protein
LIEVEIVGARQYDLIARPVLATAEIEAIGTVYASGVGADAGSDSIKWRL